MSGVLIMDMKSDGPVMFDVVDNFNDWWVEAMEDTGHNFNYERSLEEKRGAENGPTAGYFYLLTHCRHGSVRMYD